MNNTFDKPTPCEPIPSQQPLFGQVIDRLNYLNLNYTELTNYAYAMTSRIADTNRLCKDDSTKEYVSDGSIISNLMTTMDKLEDNMSKLKLVVNDLEKSII